MELQKSTITVILNIYKRLQHFDEQLEAIRNQSIKPTKIIVWNNGNTEFDINKYTDLIYFGSSNNLGVWPRFFMGLVARTEYVCVFDDDTIPGIRWLENCVETSQKVNGALGTIGILYKPGDKYEHITRVGWVNPNEDIIEVDTICHSWFFKRNDFDAFVNDLPNTKDYAIYGEDMHLTHTFQKFKNLRTYVPPHPTNNKELWGSDFDKGWKYGTEPVAISVNINFKDFSIPYKRINQHGFQSMSNTQIALQDPNYFTNKLQNNESFCLIRTDNFDLYHDATNYFVVSNLQTKKSNIIKQANINITTKNIILVSDIHIKTINNNNVIDQFVIGFHTNSKEFAAKYRNKVFLFSYDDKTIIRDMYFANPNNIYIDDAVSGLLSKPKF